MKDIKKLSDQIKDEIGDARKYALDALTYKDDKPELASMYNELSMQEMTHMKMLHGAVVNMIAKYKSENGAIPADMQMRYEIKHEEHMDAAAEVYALQAKFQRG